MSQPALPEYAVREIGDPQLNGWRRALFHYADMKDHSLETGELVIVCKDFTSSVSPCPAFAFLGSFIVAFCHFHGMANSELESWW
jgi:hypothetical protein